MVETCSFEEIDASMESVDILKFTGASPYSSKLEQYKKESNLKDARSARASAGSTGTGLLWE